MNTLNKDQIKGRIKEAEGKLKEVAGRIVGNESLEAKGKTQKLNITVAELQEDRVASSTAPGRSKPQAEAPANRLGIVVGELSAEQRKGLGVTGGLVVTDVRPDSKADVRRGDVLLTMVHKGQHTELKTVEQFNKLLAGLDKNAVITLQVRRGESTAFVTISGLVDKG
jgi:serine protease Do